MIVFFLYRSEAGRLRFSMDVDERQPINDIIEGAHEVAEARGFRAAAFVTCVIQQDKRYGRLAAIGEVIRPLVKRALS